MSKRIFIGTPTYGRPVADYFKSLYASIPVLERAGFLVEWLLHEGCCYIHTARNKIAREFLIGGADALVFIDADIGWQAVDLLALAERDVEMVAGAAPFRVGEEGYAVDWYRDRDGFPKGDVASGLIEATVLPTAMMKIKREVFLKIASNKEAPLRVEYDRKSGQERERYLSFFDFETDNARNMEFGEDVTFCRKWQRAGGKLWIHPDMTLRHYESDVPREGNLHKYLTRPTIVTSSAA